MVKKHIIKILALISILLLFSACSQTTNNIENKTITQNNLSTIALTNYPIYAITKEIVGNTSNLISAIPIDKEPHSFELTSKDIAELSSAQTFITLGGGFQTEETEILNAINTNNNLYIINSSKNIEYITLSELEEEHENEDQHEEEHEHEPNGVDPHIWLSIENQKIMAKNIYEGLLEKYPENKEIYTQNYNNLISKLNSLDNKYKSELENCQKNTILVNHNAYNYLKKDYNIEIISISGLEPESEPTAKQIKELIDISTKENLKIIFYEEKTSSEVAKIISKEIGAEILVLNTLEIQVNENYIESMENNLNNLKIALECK